jgi:hypothetical protein
VALLGELKLKCEARLGAFSRGHDQQRGKARIVTGVGARVAIAALDDWAAAGSVAKTASMAASAITVNERIKTASNS